LAGIGFELKKIFQRNSLVSKAYGYSCATVIVSGPTFLAILLLLGLEWIAASGADNSWSVLLSLITYSMLGALLTSSVLGQVLARYTADCLYRNDYGRVMPSLNGAYMVLIIPFGLLYAWIVSTAETITLTQKILNWCDYALMTFVYLQLGYLTAIKKYKRLLIWFATGILFALLFAWLFIKVFHFSKITAVENALFLGYGIIFTGNSKELYEEFPSGYGSIFKFLEYVVRRFELVICGFFSIATSFVHIILMWFGEYGMEVDGAFRAAPAYDASAFYAFLVQIPVNIMFVVSVEVNFYTRYASYFDAVSLNGTLRDIDRTRSDMMKSLKNELFRLEIIQFVVLLAYMFFMKFYLVTIGFTDSLLVIFYLLCVGYAALGLGVAILLLLLYFDSTKYAAVTAVISFAVCGLVTYLTLHNKLFYGLGLCCGGLVMFLLAAVLLDHYMQDIDNNVFCRQPIFIVEKVNSFIRMLSAHDERMIKLAKTNRERALGKEIKKRTDNSKTDNKKTEIQQN